MAEVFVITELTEVVIIKETEYGYQTYCGCCCGTWLSLLFFS